MLDGLTPRGLFPAASYIYCNCRELSYGIVSSAIILQFLGPGVLQFNSCTLPFFVVAFL